MKNKKKKDKNVSQKTNIYINKMQKDTDHIIEENVVSKHST